jgi:hypothetical protein
MIGQNLPKQIKVFAFRVLSDSARARHAIGQQDSIRFLFRCQQCGESRDWCCFFWDYANVFVTTFLRNSLAQAQLLIHTGHMTRPDQFISVPGWVGNLAVIVGSAAA